MMNKINGGLEIEVNKEIKKSIYRDSEHDLAVADGSDKFPRCAASCPVMSTDRQVYGGIHSSSADHPTSLYRDQAGIRDESSLGLLFKAYFNNKMTVLIFLCCAVRHTPEEKNMNGIYGFLDDLYHHMMEGDVQRRYRRKLIWLKGFLRKLPNVRPLQRLKAIELIRSFYDVFGIELKTVSGGDSK